jgi:hypothetical protein
LQRLPSQRRTAGFIYLPMALLIRRRWSELN